MSAGSGLHRASAPSRYAATASSAASARTMPVCRDGRPARDDHAVPPPRPRDGSGSPIRSFARCGLVPDRPRYQCIPNPRRCQCELAEFGVRDQGGALAPGHRRRPDGVLRHCTARRISRGFEVEASVPRGAAIAAPMPAAWPIMEQGLVTRSADRRAGPPTCSGRPSAGCGGAFEPAGADHRRHLLGTV